MPLIRGNRLYTCFYGLRYPFHQFIRCFENVDADARKSQKDREMLQFKDDLRDREKQSKKLICATNKLQ